MLAPELITGSGAASRVADLIAEIPKDEWAVASPDPMEELLGSLVNQAPAAFWAELNEMEILPTASRVRNWLLKMIQAEPERKNQCVSALEFLLKLTLSKETLSHIKLAPILKSFMQRPDGTLLAGQASELARTVAQHHRIHIKLAPKGGLATPPGTPPIQAPSSASSAGAPPTPSKGASELAVLKRQDRKRPREEEAPPQKRRKYRPKSVTWKNDAELLRVRQFDLELEPYALEREYVAAHEPRDEQEQPAFAPIKSAVGISQPLREMLGIKRGGLVVPPPSAPNDGPTFEPNHFPQDPLPKDPVKVKSTVIKIAQF